MRNRATPAEWLRLGLLVLCIAGIATLPGCAGRIVPLPANPATIPPHRVTLPMSAPLPGDTLAIPPVLILTGCKVYAWRLRSDTTTRLALADCTEAPPPGARTSRSGGAS